ncbi:unnamed protein product [Absidia cylindrospora]
MEPSKKTMTMYQIPPLTLLKYMVLLDFLMVLSINISINLASTTARYILARETLGLRDTKTKDENDVDDNLTTHTELDTITHENSSTNLDTSNDDCTTSAMTKKSPSVAPSTSSITNQAITDPLSSSGLVSPTLTARTSSPSILNILKKSFNNAATDKTPSSTSSTSNKDIGTSSDSLSTLPATSSSSTSKKASVSPAALDSLNESVSSLTTSEDSTALEQRLLKEVVGLFSRGMFIFAYDYDITNNLQREFKKKSTNEANLKTISPSFRQSIDKRFWWNEHLCQDFITGKFDNWVLPIMQGTIQIEPTEIDGFPFTFVLISRRSRERAGLRYQRRGVNDEGQVANFVETEQLVLFDREGVQHAASFVQTRGSIPLFWSQSPYALHPDPVLYRSDEINNDAFEKHFQQQESYYGKQVVVNLTELSGREAIIGSEYRHHIEHLGDPNIKYVEFDFHKETKGMRFENIKKLSDSLSDTMTKMAYFWEGDDDTVYCEQTGVFRTNCMDCLDRTNVVQSSFARNILNLQLMRFGISEYPDKGIKYYEHFERIFNNVWANNGDYLSRMYTGTSALKGDFTRTGKRNITGIMNDASNSLARMYFNTVKDFHRQATIDYILGYHKLDIFRRVPESNQRSAEPGIEKWLEKIRDEAIQVSCEIVIADDETKLQGWTLLAPKENKNGKPSSKRFEEKVVLLTGKALYICSYNYHLEKVVQFKRVELRTIQSIQVGEYILSSLTPEARDPDQNYGFCINYNSNNQIMRWNTGSLLNQNLDDLNILPSDIEHQKKGEDDMDDGVDDGQESDSSLSSISSASSLSSNTDDDEDNNDSMEQEAHLAFKAVRYNVSDVIEDENVSTCKGQVQDIVKQISAQCGHPETSKFIVHKPIVSLTQAEKTDGLFKKMGYKLKHAIWI